MRNRSVRIMQREELCSSHRGQYVLCRQNSSWKRRGNKLLWYLLRYLQGKVTVLRKSNIRLFKPDMSVLKKSTRSWTGMPLARKSKIFGLHSSPANTTYAPLKTRLSSGFSLTRSFSDAPVAGKTKCGFPPQKLILRLIDSLYPDF